MNSSVGGAASIGRESGLTTVQHPELDTQAKQSKRLSQRSPTGEHYQQRGVDSNRKRIQTQQFTGRLNYKDAEIQNDEDDFQVL